MRRLFWTVGMAIIGLFLGMKGQGFTVNVREVAIAGIWAAGIGYGFGSIFDQSRPGRRLVVYWTITLALVAAFFGPLLPIESFPIREALAGVIGALMGALVGTIHLKSKRGTSEESGSGATP